MKPAEHHHDLETVILKSTTKPIPVYTSTALTVTPEEHTDSKDAQSDILDLGKDFVETKEDLGPHCHDLEPVIFASKTKPEIQISMDNSKAPVSPSNERGIPKDAQVSLLDSEEDLLDSEEDIHSTLKFQDKQLLDHKQDFNSITFAKGRIQGYVRTPEVDTSMIWKPRNKKLPDIDPKLLKKIPPLEFDPELMKAIPLSESKLRKPGEPLSICAPQTAPETPDLGILPPMMDPKPLDQEQMLHKLTRALSKVDVPAVFCPKLYMEFVSSITFMEGVHSKTSSLSMSPKLATFMICRPKDKEPSSIIPEL